MCSTGCRCSCSRSATNSPKRNRARFPSIWPGNTIRGSAHGRTPSSQRSWISRIPNWLRSRRSKRNPRPPTWNRNLVRSWNPRMPNARTLSNARRREKRCRGRVPTCRSSVAVLRHSPIERPKLYLFPIRRRARNAPRTRRVPSRGIRARSGRQLVTHKSPCARRHPRRWRKQIPHRRAARRTCPPNPPLRKRRRCRAPSPLIQRPRRRRPRRRL